MHLIKLNLPRDCSVVVVICGRLIYWHFKLSRFLNWITAQALHCCYCADTAINVAVVVSAIAAAAIIPKLCYRHQLCFCQIW